MRKLIEAQPDMEIVGDVYGSMRTLQEVGRTKADAVILVQASSEDVGLSTQLLAVYPDITILTIAPNMDSAFTQQLCSRRRSIKKPRRENIVESLRAAVQKPCSEEEYWERTRPNKY
jgi:hypothetical protein